MNALSPNFAALPGTTGALMGAAKARGMQVILALHRQPASFAAGITLEDSGHRIGRGFRGAGQWAAALHAGGPRNGVLTAVEANRLRNYLEVIEWQDHQADPAAA